MISVRVPATTANFGPGFDSLGAALNLYNTVTLGRETGGWPDGFMAEIAATFYDAAGLPLQAHQVTVEGEVPRSRGLGSSVTVRLGLLMALNQLHGCPLHFTEVVRLCVELEGHPDNTLPAAYGGFCVSGERQWLRTDVGPELKFVTVIPPFELETEKARGVLPAHVPLADAVRNLQNTGLISAAMFSRIYTRLPGCFADTLHQPYRAALLPGFDECLKAAVHHGALGAFLSGSGSTLMALTLENGLEIARAMAEVLQQAGHGQVRYHLLTADNQGAQIL
jgi:homoserine kinase